MRTTDFDYHLPPESLLGIACATSAVKECVERSIQEKGRSLKIINKQSWYF